LTVFKVNGKFGVCSRNLELKSKDNNWWKVVEKYNIEKLLPDGFALQGELLGPGIQGNKYQLEDHDVYFFGGYNIKEHKYLTSDELTKLIAYLEVKQVPFLTTVTLKPDVDFFVQLSIGKSQLNGKTQREGIVIRPYNDIYDDYFSGKFQGNRISFKAVNPEFLLKYGE
jgi:RNA ligase (TIGR02306 family)